MMELVTGLDIGNGYVKGKFCGVGGTAVNVDIPSCVAGIVSPPSLPDNVSPEYIGDIFNRMICQIQSPLVRDTRYFNFGTGAIATGRSLLQFDIADSSSSKAIQPLSSILMLGIAAGEALRNYYDENKCLPAEILRAEVQAAVALPIDEYMTYRDVFSNQFMNVEHEVTICNFEVPVHVRLTFSGVHVMPEGVSAQYAITSKGEAFIQALLDDVRDHDPNALPGITARDVLSCENTCGIDIGEGTVNFPVIKDGKFNAIASSTLKQGYGTVLEQAVPRVLKANMPYDTRKVLADFLQQPVSAFNRQRKNTVWDIVKSESVDLVNGIISTVSRILRGGGVEVIYVYGGGATPMKEALYQELIDKTRGFAGGDAFPILYLDSSYARNLNREGLYEVAMADYTYRKSANQKNAASQQ